MKRGSNLHSNSSPPPGVNIQSAVTQEGLSSDGMEPSDGLTVSSRRTGEACVWFPYGAFGGRVSAVETERVLVLVSSHPQGVLQEVRSALGTTVDDVPTTGGITTHPETDTPERVLRTMTS